MSRTLRIIDGILIALLVALAVITYVPELIGYRTTAVSTSMLGNVDVGSLVISQENETTTVQKDDRILDATDDSVSVYTVTSYDPAAGTVDVEGGEETTYKLSDNYLEVLYVIPYVGYFKIAVGSTKGLIILAVLVAYIIVSLIVASLISNHDEDEEDYDEDEDEDEDDFYNDLAEKKKAKDSGKDSDNKKKSHNKKKNNKKKKQESSDSEDEDAEDEDYEDADDGMTELSGSESDVDKFDEAVEQDSENVSTQNLTDVQAALEAALDSQPLNRTEEIPTEVVNENAAAKIENLVEEDPNEPSVNENGEIELAMPVRTADEILSKAYSAGLDPTVEEDKSTGVTLVDYSDSL